MIPIDKEVSQYIRKHELATNHEKIEYLSLQTRAVQLLKAGETSWEEVRQFIIE